MGKDDPHDYGYIPPPDANEPRFPLGTMVKWSVVFIGGVWFVMSIMSIQDDVANMAQSVKQIELNTKSQKDIPPWGK